MTSLTPLKDGLRVRRERKALLAEVRRAKEKFLAGEHEDEDDDEPDPIGTAIAIGIVFVGLCVALKPRRPFVYIPDAPSDSLLPEVTPPGGKSVYFIQDGKNPRAKIGKAGDVARRMKQLQTGNPNRLRLIGWRPGYTELESALHRKLASERVGGEWFNLSPKTLSVIQGP